MRMFKRACGLTLAAAITLLAGLFAAEAVAEAAESSGFSSGELLFIGFEDKILFGEALGQRFALDFAPALAFMQKLQPLSVLLPPRWQLLLRCLAAAQQ